VKTGLLAVALLSLGVPLLGAEEPSLQAEVEARKIGVDDQFELTVTLEGSSIEGAGEITAPPMLNLRVVGGPLLSTQVSFVNGAVSQKRVVTYVLQPVAVGRAQIGPARVKVAGVEKATAPIAIEVVPGRILQHRPRHTDPFGADPFGEDPFESLFGRSRGRLSAPKLFVEVVPSRTRLYVGEPLLLAYYLYTQATVTDLQFSEAPQYPGFWSEELEKPRTSPAGEAATVDGERYRKFPVLYRLLFATRAGSLNIPAARIRIGLQRGLFDTGGPVERSTKPLAINAEAIPEEPGFSGAVGRFRTSASVDKPSVALGEAVTVRAKVEGAGNLKWIDRGPDLRIPGAKVYPPQLKSELKATADGISGSKTWEFVVIPETAGALEVPPLPFSYFDPQLGRIVRTETTALPLQVEAAPAGSAPLPAAAPAPARAASAPPLRSDLDLPRPRLPEPGARVLLACCALAILLHSGMAMGTRWAQRRPSSFPQGARRTLRTALQELNRAGRDGMSKEASAALIEKTLHDLFGSVDDPAVAGNGEGRQEVRDVLEEVRFLRYAPQLGDYSEKIREVAARAADVVRRWG
jgi:BatD DUF11 like domain